MHFFVLDLCPDVADDTVALPIKQSIPDTSDALTLPDTVSGISFTRKELTLEQRLNACFDSNRIFRAVEELHLDLDEKTVIEHYAKWLDGKQLHPNRKAGKNLEAIVSGSFAEMKRLYRIDYTDAVPKMTTDGDIDNHLQIGEDHVYIEVKNWKAERNRDQTHPQINELPDEAKESEGVMSGQKGKAVAYTKRILIITNCLTSSGIDWVNKNGFDVIEVGDKVEKLMYEEYFRKKQFIVDGLQGILKDGLERVNRMYQIRA